MSKEDDRLHNLYCQVGEHVFTTLKEVTLDRCFICNREMCPDHQGGLYPMAGERLGCVDHWAEVNRLNKANLQAGRERIRQRAEGEPQE